MVECQIVTLVVTGSSPVIYPLPEIKKINILAISSANNIYCLEIKKYVSANIICTKLFYKNVALLLNNTNDQNTLNINKTIVTLNCEKTLMLTELNKLQKKKINFFQKNKYYKFLMLYERYTSIFVDNTTKNLTNFKFNINKPNVTFNSKKIIHFNINLIKSQVFISINNNYKKIISWSLSLGILLKTSNFGKNARRTKFGFDFLLKFLKKKIKLLLSLNYFLAFTLNGHKKIINNFITWLTKLVPSAKTAFICWLPKASFNYQRKKKYAAIKKNLKKRLLKIK